MAGGNEPASAARTGKPAVLQARLRSPPRFQRRSLFGLKDLPDRSQPAHRRPPAPALPCRSARTPRLAARCTARAGSTLIDQPTASSPVDPGMSGPRRHHRPDHRREIMCLVGQAFLADAPSSLPSTSGWLLPLLNADRIRTIADLLAPSTPRPVPPARSATRVRRRLPAKIESRLLTGRFAAHRAHPRHA